MYQLYSKNGTNGSSGLSGANNKKNEKGVIGNDVATGSFKTPKEFMSSEFNPVIDKKTGEREYSEGYIIPASKSQDKLNIAGMIEILKLDYDVISCSCGTAVQNGLSKEGKKDGSPSFWEGLAAGLLSNSFSGSAQAMDNQFSPNRIYQRIKDQNEGTTIVPSN